MLRPIGGIALIALLAVMSQARAGVYIDQFVDVVPNEYVVVFEADGKSRDEIREIEVSLLHQAARNGFLVKDVWRNAIHGASISGIDEALARKLADAPGIASISPNVIGRSSKSAATLSGGLDRISQWNLPLDGFYDYFFDATGVHAYVIDGPIRTDHSDFAPSRATNDFDSLPGSPCTNSHFARIHATGVASALGGATGGVAKNVRVHGLRVTNCINGTFTSAHLISALNYVAAFGVLPGVVNISLNSGDTSNAIDIATTNVLAQGFFVAASAGNDSNSFCATTPARVAGVLTVAASAPSTDQHAYYSNAGSCIGIYAPGLTHVANPSSTTAYAGFSGTSAASPLVAGYAALLYQSGGFQIPPATMRLHILASAQNKIIGAPAGTTTKLLNTLHPW